MDFMLTFCELAGAEYPSVFEKRTITPSSGKSMVASFRDQNAKGHDQLFNEHFGARYVRKDNWKLVSLPRDSSWHLYNLAADKTETNDLSGKYPEKVQQMDSLWNLWAKTNQVFPKPTRSSQHQLNQTLLIMMIKEITLENNYGYQAFFVEGLTRHGEYFKMSPDEQHLFPTKGTSHSFTLAALDDANQLMGVVSFQRLMENRKKLAHKGELIRMYVAGENAGKNVGTALIEHLINRVRTELPEIEQINLNVATKNEKAKNLYRKFGFEHFGTERNAIKLNGKYIDDDYMVLHLKKD
jgi:ribosomal protein S18 acetylase RimI-like enzyme